jgi:hypothetical protein
MFVGNLKLKLPMDTFPSVIQSITTDGKVFELKKTGRLRGGFGGLFFPTESPMDSKRQPVQ